MLNEEFNKLVKLKDTSVLISKEEVLNKKEEIIRKMFYSLEEENKQKVLKVIRNNNLTKEIKELLSEKEIEMLKNNNFSFRTDFLALNVVISAVMNRNINDFYNKKAE